MAQKKNFKAQAESVLSGNPAMMFIDKPADQSGDQTAERAAASSERKATKAKPKAKKEKAPELAPITAELTESDLDELDELTPRPRPEAKSRRVQLLMKPRTHAAIQNAADLCGVSFNEWVSTTLEAVLKKKGLL